MSTVTKNSIPVTIPKSKMYLAEAETEIILIQEGALLWQLARLNHFVTN